MRAPLRVLIALVVLGNFFSSVALAQLVPIDPTAQAKVAHDLAEFCPQTFAGAKANGFAADRKEAVLGACLHEFHARPVADQWAVCHAVPGLCEDERAK